MQVIQNVAYSCDGNICHFRYGFQTGSVPQQIGALPSKTIGSLKISGQEVVSFIEFFTAGTNITSFVVWYKKS